MCALLEGFDFSSLRKYVSSGETLPLPIFEAWRAATGLSIIDGLGSTEMLHIFIAAPDDEIRLGATGKPIPSYATRVADDEMKTVAPGEVNRLAVRSPTGPLPGRCAPAPIRGRRVEPDQRHLQDGRGRLLLVPGAHRRHDHLVGLQQYRAPKWKRH